VEIILRLLVLVDCARASRDSPAGGDLHAIAATKIPILFKTAGGAWRTFANRLAAAYGIDISWMLAGSGCLSLDAYFHGTNRKMRELPQSPGRGIRRRRAWFPDGTALVFSALGTTAFGGRGTYRDDGR